MTALGIDLSFAPVLDLGHQCKAIGDRSFHEDQLRVTRLAGHFIEGMRQIGMATTGKHFPPWSCFGGFTFGNTAR